MIPTSAAAIPMCGGMFGQTGFMGDGALSLYPIKESAPVVEEAMDENSCAGGIYRTVEDGLGAVCGGNQMVTVSAGDHEATLVMASSDASGLWEESRADMLGSSLSSSLSSLASSSSLSETGVIEAYGLGAPCSGSYLPFQSLLESVSNATDSEAEAGLSPLSGLGVSGVSNNSFGENEHFNRSSWYRSDDGEMLPPEEASDATKAGMTELDKVIGNLESKYEQNKAEKEDGKVSGKVGSKPKRVAKRTGERKKLQNREAALRYRLKRKQEKSVAFDELVGLEERNSALRSRVADLEMEIGMMRKVIKEVEKRTGKRAT
jgi:hypothetical protein